MTSAETTAENEQLSGSMLGIIDAYRMGAAIDAQGLPEKDRPGGSAAGTRFRAHRELPFLPTESSLSDGV